MTICEKAFYNCVQMSISRHFYMYSAVLVHCAIRIRFRYAFAKLFSNTNCLLTSFISDINVAIRYLD